jgi:ABC-2 type transport system ATP-binding protein
VIEVRGLRKSYDGVEAVAGIDLKVQAGEVFAFLGPNGAGKTTTVEILEGYRRRTAGEVSVLGADPAGAGPDWRARIGVVLQESQPEDELTAEECLALYAGYYPRPQPVAEALDLVGLADRRTARCGRMSGGQQRRLDVALALIGDPKLIFLDEPTTGFDPAARKSAWEVIAGLRDLGKTIFLTTHYMEEAEYLFIPVSALPAWLARIGYVVPIHPLAAALLQTYNPHTTGSGLTWGYLASLAAWGAAGLIIAVRRFSWLPRGG